MAKFDLTNTEIGLKLYHPDSDYTLLYRSNPFFSFNGNPFLFEPPAIKGKQFCVSASTLNHYPEEIRDINPNFQYVNIGAGLDEFTEKLGAANLSQKPVVIDPANYELMAEMLTYLSTHTGEFDKSEANRLVQLCNLLLLGTSIRLINSTLGEAIKNHPEILDVGDIVIDIGGPQVYHQTEGSSPIIELEGRLVKERGRIYHSTYTYLKIDGKIVG